jgi:hypothetical protein
MRSIAYMLKVLALHWIYLAICKLRPQNLMENEINHHPVYFNEYLQVLIAA